MPVSALEQQYGPLADQAAQRYGIPPALFRNLIRSESGFNPYAINREGGGLGAVGLGQLRAPASRDMGLDPYLRTDPARNVEASARYLAAQYERFQNWLDATTAYKGGPNLPRGGLKWQEARSKAQQVFLGLPSDVEKMAGTRQGSGGSLMDKARSMWEENWNKAGELGYPTEGGAATTGGWEDKPVFEGATGLGWLTWKRAIVFVALVIALMALNRSMR